MGKSKQLELPLDFEVNKKKCKHSLKEDEMYLYNSKLFFTPLEKLAGAMNKKVDEGN